METVNHPAHYGGDRVYETVKVIEAWELNFNLGNALKYISRAGRKPGTEYTDDLQKAIWFLNREIYLHLQRATAKDSQPATGSREEPH